MLSSLVVLVFISSPCRAAEEKFVVYLVVGGVTQKEEKRDLQNLMLQEVPLFTRSDIVSYSGKNSGMKLAPSVCTKVKTLPTGTPFVVVVGGERIFQGAFWKRISSVTYGGAVILQPLEADNCVFTLELGYPTQKYYSGDNTELDVRVIRSLEASGKSK